MEEIIFDLKNINDSIRIYEEKQRAGNLLDESELAVQYTIRASSYFQNNMFKESILDYNKCIDIMERLISERKSVNGNELAKAYAGRGFAYHAIGENDETLIDISKSIDIWEHLQKNGQIIEEGILFDMYILRGKILNIMADYMDDAISDYHKFIKIAEKLKIEGKPINEDRLAQAYMGVGVSYDQKEKFAEANKYYDKCIDIWEQLISKGQSLLDYNDLAVAYMNRGSNYYVMEESAKALSNHNKNINIRNQLKKQGVEQDTYYLSISFRNRALAFIIADDYTSAINDYITAIRILKEKFSEEPGLQIIYYDTLAKLIDLVEYENNDKLLGNILQEYLYSMRSIPKTEEAEESQNKILSMLNDRN